GERIVIRGLVVISIGVEILAAVLLDDFAEFVGLDVFVGRGDVVLPILFQLLQPGFVAAHGLVALGDVGGVGKLDLFKGRFFGGVIGSADLVGSLERHVFEHVCQSRLAHGVLRRACVDQCVERKNWSLRALADQNSQAVRQFL